MQNQKHLKRPFCTSVLRALTGQIQCFRAYAHAVYPNRLCSIKNCVIEQACSVYMFKDSTASVWPRCVWLLHRFRIIKCIIFSAETRKETRFGKLFSLRFCTFYSLLNIRCSFIQQQGTIIIVRYCQLSLSSAFSAWPLTPLPPTYSRFLSQSPMSTGLFAAFSFTELAASAFFELADSAASSSRNTMPWHLLKLLVFLKLQHRQTCLVMLYQISMLVMRKQESGRRSVETLSVYVVPFHTGAKFICNSCPLVISMSLIGTLTFVKLCFLLYVCPICQ